MYSSAVSQRSQQIVYTDFGSYLQIYPIVVHLLRIASPPIFCLLGALQWLFIMFFQDSIIVICKKGKSEQAIALLPEILILFYSFHFFDEISYQFIHYGHIFLLIFAHIYDSSFKFF